jgi:uncharacterized membrane protein
MDTSGSMVGIKMNITNKSDKIMRIVNIFTAIFITYEIIGLLLIFLISRFTDLEWYHLLIEFLLYPQFIIYIPLFLIRALLIYKLKRRR